MTGAANDRRRVDEIIIPQPGERGAPVDGEVIAGGGLEEAVQSAVSKASWLADSDGAAVELALEYARQIDLARSVAKIQFERSQDDPNVDPAGALGAAHKALFLGPHLLSTLKALGLTAVDRQAVGEAVAAPVEDELSKLRKNRKGA